jgi:hypothetical protein
MLAMVEMTTPSDLPFADLALSRRLERAETKSSVEFVETRARLFPGHGATWIEAAGGYALFDGIESPLSPTFGLGRHCHRSSDH